MSLISFSIMSKMVDFRIFQGEPTGSKKYISLWQIS